MGAFAVFCTHGADDMGRLSAALYPERHESLCDIGTKAALKKLAKAHHALAEFKAIAASMPTQNILTSTHNPQEAKDSSAIESISAPHDGLYQSDSFEHEHQTLAAKEAHNYAHAFFEKAVNVPVSGTRNTARVVW
jgi:hypothetical protein